MRRAPAPKEVAVGLALKLVLDRLPASRRTRAAPSRPRPAGAPPSPPPSVKPGALLPVMLASLAVGLVLMVGFEGPVTRILGVLALFAFIVSGVFLIADPAFLGQDEDPATAPAEGQR